MNSSAVCFHYISNRIKGCFDALDKKYVSFCLVYLQGFWYPSWWLCCGCRVLHLTLLSIFFISITDKMWITIAFYIHTVLFSDHFVVPYIMSPPLNNPLSACTDTLSPLAITLFQSNILVKLIINGTCSATVSIHF